MINKEEVGQRIKMIRLSKGDTLEDFGIRIAILLNIPKENAPIKGNISRWESGLSLPSKKRLKAIAEIGDLTVEELLYGDIVQDNYADEFYEEYEKFKGRKNGLLEELKLLLPGALSGLSMGLAFREMSRNAVKDNEALLEKIKALDKFAHNHIEKNYSNYSYEKFRQEFPSSNLQDFRIYKEREIALFVELLENYWKVLDKYYSSYLFINSRLTDQIAEELTEIIKMAEEENKEEYYFNEVIQPILDETAIKIKKIVTDKKTK